MTRCKQRWILLAILVVSGGWLWLSPAQEAERRLLVPESELVEVELATVTLLRFSDTPVVLLRDPNSQSVVPIFIGPAEARAIVLAQQGLTPPRPLTHDLTATLIETMGGTLRRVIVDGLHEGTYLGALEIDLGGRRGLTLVDSRPSDALALAVRLGARIMVAPDILAIHADVPFDVPEGDAMTDGPVTALGITVVPSNAQLSEALSLPDQPGVLVSAAEGMASVLGVRAGAYITAVNGQTIHRPMDFLHAVNATEPGQPAELALWQEGERRSLKLETGLPEQSSRRQRL